MDFVKDDIRKLFWKFLATSLGSALVISIFSFVDTIAVGQSEGPTGSAAMAVLSPLFGISVSLAIMCGIGGSVLMSAARGEGHKEKGDEFFTATIILLGGVIAVTWLILALCGPSIMTFFGADEALLPTVMRYARWLIGFWPFFLLPIFLGAFVRNDGAPGLATASVVIGAIVNVFLDWYLVFPVGWGIKGAAIATVIGTTLQFFILVIHFFRKSCRLRLARPENLGGAIKDILAVGLGAGVLDFGTVFLAVILNNQVMRYGGPTALAVFGVITTLAALFQALFGGVGQAIQPLASTNFGAGQGDRIRRLFRLGLGTALALGVAFTLIGMCLPRAVTRLFMAATPEVLALAPSMFRMYAPNFFFLALTVLSTYYLQSILESRMSMTVAVLRSFVVSGILLYLLPLVLGLDGVMLALPISELLVAILAMTYIAKKANPSLPS